ncbi:calmodulin, putative [Trypanosoma cruzi]|uniref:Calmodulin, putative n=2 Tax=Trypanosoma cruzi TaxID=5693 RepID=Q4DQ24_TRYCC|nr:calmodulin, putative [Trypanosoma cruzi]EAN94615.1 calmodulin, putative [Trypanosoma cruzi]|eukprot:XP_816466.1 calmodulin [Trypanosoma cruzi strain CL Brener]
MHLCVFSCFVLFFLLDVCVCVCVCVCLGRGRMPLSETQRERFSLQFLIFDKDSDGRITTEQLGPLLRIWGFCPSEAEVQAAVRLLDPDNTGVLTKAQAFDAAESMLNQMITEVDVREALRVLDADGDGFLTTAELRHVLLNLGVRLSLEEADEVIADAYADEDQQVNTDDFARMLFSDASEGKMDI